MTSETDLRDQLALDRTELANERTLLAYVRTVLGLLGAGVGLLHFAPGAGGAIGGWTLVAAAAVTFPLGVWRYLTIRRHLRAKK